MNRLKHTMKLPAFLANFDLILPRVKIYNTVFESVTPLTCYNYLLNSRFVCLMDYIARDQANEVCFIEFDLHKEHLFD